MVALPDLANKNSVKCEFQITNKYFFSVSVAHTIFPYTKKYSLFIWNSTFTGCPLFYLAMICRNPLLWKYNSNYCSYKCFHLCFDTSVHLPQRLLSIAPVRSMTPSLYFPFLTFLKVFILLLFLHNIEGNTSYRTVTPDGRTPIYCPRQCAGPHGEAGDKKLNTFITLII